MWHYPENVRHFCGIRSVILSKIRLFNKVCIKLLIGSGRQKASLMVEGLGSVIRMLRV